MLTAIWVSLDLPGSFVAIDDRADLSSRVPRDMSNNKKEKK
jgi:hypothetical protein